MTIQKVYNVYDSLFAKNSIISNGTLEYQKDIIRAISLILEVNFLGL